MITDSELVARLLELAHRLVIDPAMNSRDGPPIVEFKNDDGMLVIGRERDDAIRAIAVEVIRFRDMRETGE